jgi:hypothetical protein
MAEEAEKFNAVAHSPLENQAVYFLNAFWEEGVGEKAEDIWKYYEKFIELQKVQHKTETEGKDDAPEFKEGPDLPELYSLKFLESFGKALSAIAFRQEFKKIDVNFDKKMALIEFLLHEFKRSVGELMAKPQASSPELEAAQKAYAEVMVEVNKIEAEKAKLEKDSKGDGVKAKAAKNALEQLQRAEHVELDKAVVRAEAAVKKAQRTVKPAPGPIFWLNKKIEVAKKYKPSGHGPKAAALFE